MEESKKKSLLIVDDEPELREILEFLFRRRGLEIHQASNGRAAYELLTKTPIHAILSDVRMANGDGLELLEKAKAMNPELPMVLMTGFADLLVENAYALGADGFFSKPFDLDQLVDRIAEVLLTKNERWSSRPQGADTPSFSLERHFSSLDSAIREKSLNLGRGGIFVALKHGLPNPGSKVGFSIRFDEHFPAAIQGCGTVKWVRAQRTESRPEGCGIQFDYLDDSCRPQLIDSIESRRMIAFIPKT